MNPNAVVDYKNADLTVIVDVVKDTACCSVVPKFFHFKRYNLGELANAAKAKLEPEPAEKQPPANGAENSSCEQEPDPKEAQEEPGAEQEEKPEVTNAADLPPNELTVT